MPVEIYLDEFILSRLIDIFWTYYEANLVQETIKYITDDEKDDEEEEEVDYLWNYRSLKARLKQKKWSKIYIESFLISPLSGVVTIKNSGKTSETYIIIYYRLITTLGVSFDETKMKLESFQLSSLTCSPKKFLKMLLKHYVMQCLSQTYFFNIF